MMVDVALTAKRQQIFKAAHIILAVLTKNLFVVMNNKLFFRTTVLTGKSSVPLLKDRLSVSVVMPLSALALSL
jgi:hypothetical protein